MARPSDSRRGAHFDEAGGQTTALASMPHSRAVRNARSLPPARGKEKRRRDDARHRPAADAIQKDARDERRMAQPPIRPNARPRKRILPPAAPSSHAYRKLLKKRFAVVERAAEWETPPRAGETVETGERSLRRRGSDPRLAPQVKCHIRKVPIGKLSRPQDESLQTAGARKPPEESAKSLWRAEARRQSHEIAASGPGHRGPTPAAPARTALSGCGSRPAAPTNKGRTGGGKAAIGGKRNRPPG